MRVIVRKETDKDHKAVFEIIKAAFVEEAYSNQTEHFLVERLRTSEAFIPELSLVADYEGQIVGHILLTKIWIKNDKFSFPSLALAPVSVHPDFQRKGIGGQLIRAAHQKAKELGHASVILIGHETYYPRFGYEMTSTYGISLPFDAPPQNCMVKKLIENGLKGVSGTVEYPPEFL